MIITSIVSGLIAAEKVVAQALTLSNKSFDIRVIRVVALVLRFSETNQIFGTLLYYLKQCVRVIRGLDLSKSRADFFMVELFTVRVR